MYLKNKNNVISFRLNDQMLETLDQLCKIRKWDRSYAINYILEDYFLKFGLLGK